MTNVSLDRIASALGMTNEKTPDTHIWATVSSINADGSYQVQMNGAGASETTRAARLCNASVGDRVFCVVSNGKATAIGRVGGDFPIGYIYLSYANVSPASLFGGTWEQLTDVFLRAANDTQTGGSDTHRHAEGDLSAAIGAVNNDILSIAYRAGAVNQRGPSTVTQYTLWGADCSSSQRTFNHYTGVYGTTASTSTMPAYQNIYAWRRTA